MQSMGRRPWVGVAVSIALASGTPAAGRQGPPISDHAKQLQSRAIVIDTHDDTTQRLLFDKTFDIAQRNSNGNIDIPRMREGGLDALFFSIWVPSTRHGSAGGAARDGSASTRSARRSARIRTT